MSKRDAYPFKRRGAFRLVRESFLILCEGENTEPIYFNAFRLVTATVRALPVRAGDAKAVVRSAIKRRNVETNKGNDYEHYWVVFDKDETADQAFNEAIALAEENGFRVAYSNQAFELWFVLHFEYISRPMHRRQHTERLTALLGFPYEKDKETTRRICRVLLNQQEQAIGHAQRLLSQYRNNDPRNPATEESSTTVHQLVEELRRFL